MKINFLHITFFIAIIIFGFSFSNKKFSDPNKEKLLIEIVKYVVEKGHYNSIEIDDGISEKIFNSYIEQLDNQKRFFLQSDIRQFEKYKFTSQLPYLSKSISSYPPRSRSQKIFSAVLKFLSPYH